MFQQTHASNGEHSQTAQQLTLTLANYFATLKEKYLSQKNQKSQLKKRKLLLEKRRLQLFLKKRAQMFQMLITKQIKQSLTSHQAQSKALSLLMQLMTLQNLHKSLIHQLLSQLLKMLFLVHQNHQQLVLRHLSSTRATRWFQQKLFMTHLRQKNLILQQKKFLTKFTKKVSKTR